MISPKKIKEEYLEGKNISALLRKELETDHNTQEIIEISYDMQSGSYVEAMNSPDMIEYKEKYTGNIANILTELTTFDTIMEAGVGEATTLSGVLKNFTSPKKSFGFDLSWSRIAFAKNYLHSEGIDNFSLCTGNLFQIPFADNSIDIVYTSHSIEPNGGRENDALKELFRITRKFLILLEPGYELASEDAKKRMDFHGYCQGLPNKARELGYNVTKHELFPICSNPLNPTAITIIEKKSNLAQPDNFFACPNFKVPLIKHKDSYFSREGLVAYPIISDIPCLRTENGIFASHYESF